MYYEIGHNNASLMFGPEELPTLPCVTIMPVNVFQTEKFQSLAELPHHRIDLYDPLTAFRVGVWLRFSDWSFDNAKFDGVGMEKLVVQWLEKMVEVVSRVPGSLELVDLQQYGGLGRADEREQTVVERVGRDLWHAMLQFHNREPNSRSHLAKARISLHETDAGEFYDMTMDLGNGVHWYGTRKDNLPALFGSTHYQPYSSTPSTMERQGTFYFQGQTYDFVFLHYQLGRQLVNKVDLETLMAAHWEGLKTKLPFLLKNRTNIDLELNFTK